MTSNIIDNLGVCKVCSKSFIFNKDLPTHDDKEYKCPNGHTTIWVIPPTSIYREEIFDLESGESMSIDPMTKETKAHKTEFDKFNAFLEIVQRKFLQNLD